MTLGLEDVVAAETRLSGVDGTKGELVIAGQSVEHFATLSFEHGCGRLWDAPQDLAPALGRARVEAFELLAGVGNALTAANPMDSLRAVAGHLVCNGVDWLEDAARVTGAMTVFVAAGARVRAGQRPVPPDPSLGHAQDLLRMLRETIPTADEVRALDAYLCTVIDHGLNASTFTARVVASTQSDLVSAVVAAVGALKGRLHGGAPGPVLDMLDAIGEPPSAQAWIAAELDAGRRIMGMGHRVYRVRDPRAAVLEGALNDLRIGDPTRRALAREVERQAQDQLRRKYPGRTLCANVEFFTAIVLEALAIPRDLFTAVFATSRVAGWCAHVREQRQTGRLIRPRGRYIGRSPTDAR